MTEHNCEIPRWRCYGDGPIKLRFAVFDDIDGSGCIEIDVNYCPFCGVSETLFELSKDES